MLALYRSGRQADALEVYQRARRNLDEQLGIEPGPALRELERKILNQDEALEGPTAVPIPATAASGPRRAMVLGVAAFVLVAVVAAAIAAARDSSDGLNEVARTMSGDRSETHTIVAAVPVGIRPGRVPPVPALSGRKLEDRT
jgi:hypothetical protein